MTCDEVRAMLDSEGAPTTGEANAHVHDCAECQAFWQRWQETRGTLRAMGEEDPPPFLHTRLMAYVREAAQADAHKESAWLFGLKKIWAGPLLVLFLGILLGGYGLVKVLRPPQPAGEPALRDSSKDKSALSQKQAFRPAPGERQEPSAKRAAPPSVSHKEELVSPSSSGIAAGGPPAERTTAAPSQSRPGDLFSPKPAVVPDAVPPGPQSPPPAAMSSPKGASPAEPSVEGGVEGGMLGGVVNSPSENAPSTADSQAIHRALESRAVSSDEEPSEVVCTLSPLSGSGPFLSIQLPTGAAPAAGSAWVLHLGADGSLRILNALGKPVDGPAATVAGVMASHHLPAGSYRLKRIS